MHLACNGVSIVSRSSKRLLSARHRTPERRARDLGKRGSVPCIVTSSESGSQTTSLDLPVIFGFKVTLVIPIGYLLALYEKRVVISKLVKWYRDGPSTNFDGSLH